MARFVALRFPPAKLLVFKQALQEIEVPLASALRPAYTTRFGCDEFPDFRKARSASGHDVEMLAMNCNHKTSRPRFVITAVSLAVLVTFASSAKADHFEDQSLAALQKIGSNPAAKKVAEFSFDQINRLPKVIDGAPGSVLVIAKTDQGNWSKLLVRPGGIKLKNAAEPVPVLVIERLITFSADPRRGYLADRRDLWVFDGYALDLDTGHILPVAGGADVSFKAGVAIGLGDKTKSETSAKMADEKSAPAALLKGTIKAENGAEIYLTAAAPITALRPTTVRLGGGATTPADFVGTFALDIDGRITGQLDISQNNEGKLSGRFSSDQTGSVYGVTLETGNPAHRVQIKIAFPRSEISLEGHLWTRERKRIAGTAKVDDRPFAFVAERKK